MQPPPPRQVGHRAVAQHTSSRAYIVRTPNCPMSTIGAYQYIYICNSVQWNWCQSRDDDALGGTADANGGNCQEANLFATIQLSAKNIFPCRLAILYPARIIITRRRIGAHHRVRFVQSTSKPIERAWYICFCVFVLYTFCKSICAVGVEFLRRLRAGIIGSSFDTFYAVARPQLSVTYRQLAIEIYSYINWCAVQMTFNAGGSHTKRRRHLTAIGWNLFDWTAASRWFEDRNEIRPIALLYNAKRVFWLAIYNVLNDRRYVTDHNYKLVSNSSVIWGICRNICLCGP